MATDRPAQDSEHYLESEMLEKLATREGRRRLRARCAAMVAAEGAERIDVERSKALRQVVEAEEKSLEVEELEGLAERNERAADRLENPDAFDAAGEGAEAAAGSPSPSGEVH